jgi:hypothetical protein
LPRPSPRGQVRCCTSTFDEWRLARPEAVDMSAYHSSCPDWAGLNSKCIIGI